MPDLSHVTINIIGFYVLMGLGAVIGALKLLDWFIGMRYVTHYKCEKCRTEIFKSIATDHDLLTQLNAKMDIILDKLDYTNDK